VCGLALLGVRSIGIYFVLGSLTWLAVDASGIHPTVTGVILGLLTPTRRWVSDERLHAILGRVVAYPAGDYWGGDAEDLKVLSLAETAARETLSPVERLEMMLHPWVGFAVMPLFCLGKRRAPDIRRRSPKPRHRGRIRWIGARQADRCLDFRLAGSPLGFRNAPRGSRLEVTGYGQSSRRNRFHDGIVHR
jgi:hypothetical protein